MPFLSCLLPPLHFQKYSSFQPRTCYPSLCPYWSPLGFFSGLQWNQGFHVQLILLASCPSVLASVTTPCPTPGLQHVSDCDHSLCTEHLCTRSKML
jgi:hypothetical protein